MPAFHDKEDYFQAGNRSGLSCYVPWWICHRSEYLSLLDIEILSDHLHRRGGLTCAIRPRNPGIAELYFKADIINCFWGPYCLVRLRTLISIVEFGFCVCKIIKIQLWIRIKLIYKILLNLLLCPIQHAVNFLRWSLLKVCLKQDGILVFIWTKPFLKDWPKASFHMLW